MHEQHALVLDEPRARHACGIEEVFLAVGLEGRTRGDLDDRGQEGIAGVVVGEVHTGHPCARRLQDVGDVLLARVRDALDRCLASAPRAAIVGLEVARYRVKDLAEIIAVDHGDAAGLLRQGL